jgi:hypothetical protein
MMAAMRIVGDGLSPNIPENATPVHGNSCVACLLPCVM